MQCAAAYCGAQNYSFHPTSTLVGSRTGCGPCVCWEYSCLQIPSTVFHSRWHVVDLCLGLLLAL